MIERVFDNRYKRNEMVIGKEAQRRLAESSVLVIGCGALGSLAAMYLAGAGVGRIGLVDFDTIDPTNLQRQLFYSEHLAGKSKAKSLAIRISELNSEIEPVVIETLFTKENGAELAGSYDFIIEATDNPSSKYLVDRICYSIGKPVCIGGVSSMRGQVTTFLPGHKRFADFFPSPPENSGILPCAAEGVLGPAAGVISCVQASEALKYLAQKGGLLIDKMLIINLENLQFMTLH